MSTSGSRRWKRWSLATGIVGFAALWIAGPAPVESSVYIHSVTAESAVIARIEREAAALKLSVQPSSGGETIEVAADQATRFHNLTVEGLSPDTGYRFVVERAGGAEEHGSFRTPPVDDKAPIRFAAVGDTGKTPWWFRYFDRFGWTRARSVISLVGGMKPQWQVAQAMAKKELDLFVHLGDIVYPDGRLSYYEEALFLPFADVLPALPIAPVPGNHDYGTDLGDAYFRVFHGGEAREHYTFTWGPARFVMINSDPIHASKPGSALAKWLDATLAASTEPWLIVAMHEPILCSSTHADNERLTKHILPLLVKHRVDLLLAGHSHNYQRFKPVDGVTQVISGAGGHRIYEVKPDERLAAWSEDYGFLAVEISGPQLRGEYCTIDGQVSDQFELVLTENRVPAANPRSQRMRALLR